MNSVQWQFVLNCYIFLHQCNFEIIGYWNEIALVMQNNYILQPHNGLLNKEELMQVPEKCLYKLGWLAHEISHVWIHVKFLDQNLN